MDLTEHYKPYREPKVSESELFFAFREAKSKEFWFKSGEAHTPTQKELLRVCPKPLMTVFNNGNVHFPFKDRDVMYEAMAQDIETGSHTYWNQIAHEDREGMRLVIDIDSEKRVFMNSEIRVIMEQLDKTLKEYYTCPGGFKIYCSVCGPRMKRGNLCSGIHIVVHLQVTVKQACQIVFKLKINLKRSRMIDMADLDLDSSIYKTRAKEISLRFIYSYKIETCPMCKKHVSHVGSCSFCEKRGEVISAYTYKPYLEYCNGEFSEPCMDPYHSVTKYSIWPEIEDVRGDYCKPESHPTFVSTTSEKKAVAEVKAAATKKPPKEINATARDYEKLESIIHKFQHFDGKYRWQDAEVSNLSKTSDGSRIFVSIKGGCSGECPYANTDHGPERTYFMVYPSGFVGLYCRSTKLPMCKKPAKRVTFRIEDKIILRALFGPEAMMEEEKKSEKFKKKRPNPKGASMRGLFMDPTAIARVAHSKRQKGNERKNNRW